MSLVQHLIAWQTISYIILLAKRLSASSSLSLHVNVLVCWQSRHFFIYEFNIRSYLQPGAPRTTNLNQILSHILTCEKTLETNEIRNMAVNKSKWSQFFVVSDEKKPPERSSLPEWWWLWWSYGHEISDQPWFDHDEMFDHGYIYWIGKIFMTIFLKF